MDVQGIRLHFLLNLAQNGVEAGSYGLGGHHHGHIVDAVGHVIHADAVPLQHGEHPPQHAHLAAHAPLADGDDGEILLAGDAGDEPLGVAVLVEPLLDDGAGVIGGIGVADVQGDILLPDGEDGALVEHLSAGVAQLPQLVIGHLGDGLGVLHDPGVRHEDAADVRPVLVDLRVQCRRRQSPGDVAAAPAEGADAPVGHEAVEAGDHRAQATNLPPEGLVGGFLVHGAVKIELHPVRRIDELEA